MPRGEMVHDLSAGFSQIADKAWAHKEFSHFDLGGDPISLVSILIRDDSRSEGP